MIADLYKVYCYRGKDKQIWFEAEDAESGRGIAWSPDLNVVKRKIKKLGYTVRFDKPIIKFYRARERYDDQIVGG